MLNSIKRKQKFHSRLTRSRSCMFSLSCLTSISRVSGSCITDLKAKTNCIPLNSNWYLSGFAKRYLQDLLATVSSEACSVLDHFFLMFSVQKTPDKQQKTKKEKRTCVFNAVYISPPPPSVHIKPYEGTSLVSFWLNRWNIDFGIETERHHTASFDVGGDEPLALKSSF